MVDAPTQGKSPWWRSIVLDYILLGLITLILVAHVAEAIQLPGTWHFIRVVIWLLFAANSIYIIKTKRKTAARDIAKK
ncbi:MAG: hypothetical protein JWP13_50 [Candidatus Saccharibacteria bacterium]|nr:hypothetical protein [Candidatus Saccharibacteria bacterium]